MFIRLITSRFYLPNVYFSRALKASLACQNQVSTTTGLVQHSNFSSKSGPKKPESDDVPKELFDYPGKEHTVEWRATEKGKIYDKKPFKFRCVKGKVYYWCNCGFSHTQPFCDGTHKEEKMKIKLRPVKFIPTEDKDYWFCNCKQTAHRPLCDGTHKRQDIQEAVKT